MIGVDTNVLVRFLTQDDPEQALLASRFLENHCSRHNPGLINRIVLCELVWVLETAYDYPRTTVADVLERLFRTAQLVLEEPENTWSALRAYREGKADFADCLLGLINRSAGCEITVTLDRKAARLPYFTLLDRTAERSGT